RGGIAATIEGGLRQLFLDNFEKGMAQFRWERDTDTTALLREMALYFAEFVPGPTNRYHSLLRAIRRSRHRTVIATTNYDLLLESAVDAAKLRTAYQAVNIPKNNVAILKIHGSCNFLPSVPGSAL